MLLLALLACQESRLPEGVLVYTVDATAADIDADGIADSCHPDSTEGWTDTFEYAVELITEADGTLRTTLYVDGVVLGTGQMVDGCEMEYETVVMEEQTENDGLLRWQLFGTATFDVGDDACVEGENDWEGTETFEIVAAEDETVEVGCTYETTTVGRFVPTEE